MTGKVTIRMKILALCLSLLLVAGTAFGESILK